MEKTITNAVLLSASIVVVCLVVFPPLHLWAQNDIQIDEKVKMHKATIEDVDTGRGTVTVLIGESTVPVTTNASTTVFFGNGDEASLDALQSASNVYVFGSYNKETRTIEAEKVVIRNKRITERTTLSRAQQEQVKTSGTFSTFEMLGLTGSN